MRLTDIAKSIIVMYEYFSSDLKSVRLKKVKLHQGRRVLHVVLLVKQMTTCWPQSAWKKCYVSLSDYLISEASWLIDQSA